MRQDEERRVPGVAYPILVVVLGLAVGACEDKSSTGNAPAAVPQAVQPVAPKVGSPTPADTPKAPESAQASENAALAAKVKAALEADPALRGSSVDVGVSAGVATLYGTADTRAHRDKAAQLAAKVPGVKSVKNEMVIVAGS